MKIMMKHTANYIALRANEGIREYIGMVDYLNKNIVKEKEKFFILKDEQVPEVVE